MFLRPLSALFGAIMAVRNWLFDAGLITARRVPVPVISVGNISVGGTGKTPFVEFLASSLQRENRRVAVISRGYGRRTKGLVIVSDGKRVLTDAAAGGDEAVQIARRVKGTIVLVDARRAKAAELAVRDFGATVVVADDAFQHRFLHRDLDIVMMTRDEVLTGDRLLPVGRRREPLSALRRADVVVISACSSVKEFDAAHETLRKVFDGPTLGFRLEFVRFRRLGGQGRTEGQKKKMGRMVAFSGIARPLSFRELVEGQGVTVVEHIQYKDHHWYSTGDLNRIAEIFRRTKADAIVTTEKDGARLEGVESRTFVAEHPVYVAEVRPKVFAGNKMLETRLREIFEGN